ncbi:MAG: DEAD/DEAH box helicase [Rickettsiaceae bacterium]|nr:MAG: DEAD/DEAH box helicase [Rickettsiaceae bacterium]
MKNFNDMTLPSEIIASLDKMNITVPTEIQVKTIPSALKGADILASSQTGSGKTLAYLLPIIASINNIDNNRALVLVPTRELAHQVRSTLNKVTINLKISSAVLIGGEPMMKQYAQLKSPPQVVVATPGRLIDHLNQGTLKLNGIKILVLDEMDRMLDMGMKEQVAEINKHINTKAQVLMFSATMPADIIAFSQKYVVNPERISIGSSTKAAAQIKQETLHISDGDKFGELVKQLTARAGSAIVFVKTKRGADQLAKLLKFQDFKADAIHGDLNQSRRDRVISSFSAGRSQVLVATDVAARGLDIKHIMHVINYDLPMCAEDYLHRIGRTGRAGAEGHALSFISPDDMIRWKAIDRLMTKGESTKREDMMGSRGPRKSFNGDRKKFVPAGTGNRKRSKFGSDRPGGNRKPSENFKHNRA